MRRSALDLGLRVFFIIGSFRGRGFSCSGSVGSKLGADSAGSVKRMGVPGLMTVIWLGRLLMARLSSDRKF